MLETVQTTPANFASEQTSTETYEGTARNPAATPDVVFLSSIFNTVKIAEPMGLSILTASLRSAGFSVQVEEPSLDGLTIAEAVTSVMATGAPIVALSMLRDKNVQDVLQFTTELRRRGSRQFVVIGGHGPSLTLSDLRDDLDVYGYLQGKTLEHSNHNCSTENAKRSADSGDLLQIGPMKTSVIVEPEHVGRGQGPGSITPNHSTYWDVSREYLQILLQVDAFLLGEADHTLPELVKRVLAKEAYMDVPGLVYLDSRAHMRKNPLLPKIIALDELPYMARDTLSEYQTRYHDVPASILASRGCFYRCTFCSVVKYESIQEGLNHRVRSNEDLVGEIRMLHDKHGVTKFNFEDDNFIVKNKAGRERLHRLCDAIIALPFKVQFAFFCRADVVDADLFGHLKEAGLTGIYFGVESVYEGDLDFFHKGLKPQHMYRALDTLVDLGFSPSVDAELRVMLGYITWHPKTSIESLRASSTFLRQYGAPPKLLRRKLRLYSGTEVLGDVARMGLLDPEHRDGWRFQNARIQGLDDLVNDLFATVNKTRDKIRTLEKAAREYGYAVPSLPELHAHREMLDEFCFTAFDQLIDACDADPDGASGEKVQAATSCLEYDLREAITHELAARISDGYRACGFDRSATDLFRK